MLRLDLAGAAQRGAQARDVALELAFLAEQARIERQEEVPDIEALRLLRVRRIGDQGRAGEELVRMLTITERP